MRILMIPAWYPTKENPLAGSFFREQANMLSSEYTVTVLTYNERSAIFGGKISLSLNKNRAGIEEYHAVVSVSYFSKILQIVENIFLGRRNVQGVGRYHSKRYKNEQKKNIQKLKRMLNMEYDMVYGISAQGIAYQAALFAELANVPLAFGEHSPFPLAGNVVSDVLKESMERADVFFAISNDKIRQVMLQNVKLQEIQYVGNLIDEEVFAYAPAVHTEKTILIVAANSFYKNYDMFIETMNRLTEMTDVSFRVVIAGYDANKGYCRDVELLEKKVSESKFSDRVEMIKFVKREDMPALYNRVDAFVMTSIQEGQPVSALEAACCGLPIFSTRCGGVEDYVTDDIGRIVGITDCDALAEYLRQFLEEEIQFSGDRIREQVVSRFGKEAFLRNMRMGFDKISDR